MEFPLNVLMQAIADFMLPLCRISAMFALMTGIGARTVPTRIKMALAVAFTFMVMPALPKAEHIDLMSAFTVIQVLPANFDWPCDGLYLDDFYQHLCPCRANFGNAKPA